MTRLQSVGGLPNALIAACLLLVLATGATSVDAQVLQTIKKQTQERVDARKKRVDSTIVQTAGKAVDSTLNKTERGADAVIDRAGTAVDTVLNRAERGIASAVSGSAEGAIHTGISQGRLQLALTFVPGRAELPADGDAYLASVADALGTTSGAWLIEAHVAASGNESADRTLSSQRAAAIKAALLTRGIAPDRLFVMGFGSSRPPHDSATATERVELAQMQN